MAAKNSVLAPISFGGLEAGFAKLQGENFSYVMRVYSIILGRNVEMSEVDVDLSDFGARIKKISRHHACIFYDFENHHFTLEVLGKHGCMIQGVTYPPGSDPVKLNSQDLIEIMGAKFYFLLPTRSIYATIAAHCSTPLQGPNHPGCLYGKKSGNGKKVDPKMQGKLKQKSKKSSGGVELNISSSCAITADLTRAPGERDKSKHNTDNQHVLLEEEKDVVSSIATLISDLCGPGEWVTMMKLHSELLERFGKTWCLDDVSKYLNPEEGSSTEANIRPWCKLLPLLKKYPDIFVINTTTRGEVTLQYVGLVSLVP